MGTPFKMKGSSFYGKGNQSPAKNIRPTSGYDIQADEVNQAHNKTDGKPGHHDYVAPKGDGKSSMKMKSPVKGKMKPSETNPPRVTNQHNKYHEDGWPEDHSGNPDELGKSKAAASPLDHTTNRLGHEKNYGKGHENSAHPNYWKKKKSKDGKEGKTPKKIEIEKSDYMKKAFPHMSPRT